MAADTLSITESLKAEARRLGFDLVGATPAVTPGGVSRLADWLQCGHAGEMHYIERRREAYTHPRHVLDGCRSLLMLSVPYAPLLPEDAAAAEGSARIARYAVGSDYHDVLRERLNTLADYLHSLAPQAAVRGVVDTAPLLEREFAQLAGIGWIGKNTLLLNRQRGSYFFLAALLTDLELEYDTPEMADHCGSCTACLDACPTDAFAAPHVLDSRRCISYLTIELKTAIPRELRGSMGGWLFGCDVCQKVCPWNRFAPPATEPKFAARADSVNLDPCELLRLDGAEFRRRFRDTPLWRPRRRGLLRNAAIVVGNLRPTAGPTALALALADEEPLIRGAAAWALGQYQTPEVQTMLLERQAVETDAEVQAEIGVALATFNV